MKRRKRIRPEELSLEIAAALKDYSIDVTDEIKKTVKQVAKEAAKELKETSPKHTGEYAKGWKTKVTNETNLDLTVTIYNAKNRVLRIFLNLVTRG